MEKNMANAAGPAVGVKETAPSYSEFRRVVKVFLGRKLAVVGLVLIILLILTAILAPWLAPYPPNDINMALSLAKPSAEHWLGTDNLGRDVLSRIIYGAELR
jgi:peptide/nickel transport system permease protein